jgi:Ner family transcriptional regulator
MVPTDSLKKAALRRSRNDPPASDWHPADVKAALEKAGWTLRRLAKDIGYHDHSALARALYQAAPVAERIIAQVLKKAPKEIWPSRYDHAGRPKGRIRPDRDPLTITRQRLGHVLNGGAV